MTRLVTARVLAQPGHSPKVRAPYGGCAWQSHGSGGEEQTMADFNPPRLDPVSMAWNTVASYSSYEEAQAAVDRLSDQSFPVENLDIVGSGLRLVERVTGRLTTARATAAGAASGAWFGLFIGLLVGLFTRGPTWIGLIIGGLLIGAVWGAVFGFASHAATRGRRDFSSAQSLVASRYDIIARGGHAEQARSILQQAGLLTDHAADAAPPQGVADTAP